MNYYFEGIQEFGDAAGLQDCERDDVHVQAKLYQRHT